MSHPMVRLRARFAERYPTLSTDAWYRARPADEAGWVWLDAGSTEVKASQAHLDMREEHAP